MAEQNNETFDEKSQDPTNLFCSITRSECNNISNLYIHGHSRDLGCGCGHDRDHDCGHGHKENFKKTFYHQNWNSSVKKGKIMANKMKVYVIITMVKVI